MTEAEFEASFKKLAASPSFKFLRAMFDKYFDLKSNFTMGYMRTYVTYGMPLEIEGIRFANRTDRGGE